ncbi:MAG: long-chain fatty acid--CoA ligase, partial [Solirubrobacterales bacterium]|nr:long-chain fatty acid--CoA ligase [Solirubrobacterales bacterium]
MEAAAASTSGTGSETMADLVPLAAARYGDAPALRHRGAERWEDVSYAELGRAVAETAAGLVDLGLAPGDRVSILSHSRPEWTYANFAILCAGLVSVSIYQTNSPEECHYVLEHSESRAVFCEDAEQVAKVRAVADRLPRLEHVIVFDPSGDTGDAIALADLRARGAAADPEPLRARTAAVGRDDLAITIYTSGTTGPPKGCLLTHGNYRDVVSMTEQLGGLQRGDSVYLFLPLAHAFAKLIQFVALDLGGTIAYWQKDPQKIVADLIEVRPTYFPSVPRMFEKIYTLATAAAEDPEELGRAVAVGLEVRRLRAAGEPVPAELEAAFAAADEKLYANVRALFGGEIRECVTGAAPIAREILEFFYACGVPVMEGYGMTETSTVASANTPEEFRFGSVGRPLPGVEATVADDGELLLRGPNIFQGYYKNPEATAATLADGWLHTGDLAHIDDDGFIRIVGRKKDIIITSGGKNVTPANLENGIKQCRWVSQAVVLGDRRPYLVALVALDPDELAAFAAEHGLEPDAVPASPQMRAAVQEA